MQNWKWVNMNFSLMAQSKENMLDDPIPINKLIIILTVNARVCWSCYACARSVEFSDELDRRVWRYQAKVEGEMISAVIGS